MTQDEKQARWALWILERLAETARTLREQAQRVEDDAKRFAQLAAENAELREALRWYVDNDDTVDDMPGNEFWLEGRNRARALLDYPPEANDRKVIAVIRGKHA